jgi:hypothetical protein
MSRLLSERIEITKSLVEEFKALDMFENVKQELYGGHDGYEGIPIRLSFDIPGNIFMQHCNIHVFQDISITFYVYKDGVLEGVDSRTVISPEQVVPVTLAELKRMLISDKQLNITCLVVSVDYTLDETGYPLMTLPYCQRRIWIGYLCTL